MTSYNAAGRYQYRDFEFGVVYRAIASVLLLTSLFYLLLQEWSDAPNKRLSAIASIIYIVTIMIDMHVWLWWFKWGWVYYEIILVHTLPILVILSKLKIDIKPKHLFFTGFQIICLGFLFDIIFINIPYPDMTDELYERTITLEKIRNLIYYTGTVTLLSGIITLIKRRQAQRVISK